MGDYVERVKEAFEAFNRRDFEAVSALCAEDVEWTPPAELPGSRTYVGHDGVRAALSDMIEIFSDLQAEPVRFIEEGRRVIGLYRWHGTAPGSNTSFDAFEVQAGGICDFDDNGLIKVARFWTNWDDTEATAERERVGLRDVG